MLYCQQLKFTTLPIALTQVSFSVYDYMMINEGGLHMITPNPQARAD